MADTSDKRQEREALELAQREADLKHLLSLPQGRRVLARFVYEFGALEVSAYALDAQQHAYQAGQRAVGVALNRELYLLDRDGWARMRSERDEALRLEPVDRTPNKVDD